MKPLPSDINTNDISQWLEGGWFLFQSVDKEGLEPAQVVFNHDNEQWSVVDIEGKTHPFLRSSIFPVWPECGSLNLEGFAIYLQREQQRQWRRTYNDRCLTLTVPRKWDVMKMFGTEVTNVAPDHSVVVRAAFTPRYYTFSDALTKIENERWLSIALNPHMIIAGAENNYLVYYRGKLIAHITNGKIISLGLKIERIQRLLKFFEGRVTL